MARAHTAAAAVLVAGIVLVPLSFWLYAQAASADRGQAGRARDAAADGGRSSAGGRAKARPLNVYERRKWNGEGLVPIAGYTVETAHRLRSPVRPARIVAHYKRELPGWRAETSTLGPTFVRGGESIEIDIVEYRDGSPKLRSYGMIVSQ